MPSIVVCGVQFPDPIVPVALDEVESKTVIGNIGTMRKRLSEQEVR